MLFRSADGGCINFKDASLALAAIVNTSCVGELRIHEAGNFVGFKTPALTGDTTYTLPAAYAACNGMALTSTTGGVMSWAAAGDGNDISARVYGSGRQAIPNATYTAIILNTESYDTDTLHASSNAYFTIQTAGKYAISGSALFTTNTTGYRAVSVRVRPCAGSTSCCIMIAETRNCAFSASLPLSIYGEYNLAACDVVSLSVWQNSTGDLCTCCILEGNNWLAVHRINNAG